MHTKDRGKVTRDASASRQSRQSRAAMLMMGSTMCPAPSGIMSASRHHFTMAAVVAAPAAKRHITWYMR